MRPIFLLLLGFRFFLLLAQSGATDLPYNAPLTLEGYAVSSPNILIGRFSKSESHGAHKIGYFRVNEVLAGSKKPGMELKLNSRTTTWMRFSDSDDILVFYPNTIRKEVLPPAGKKKEVVQKIGVFLEKQKTDPFGSIQAIGVRLEDGRNEDNDFIFDFTVKNFSRQKWHVNLDRKIRSSNHRSVAVLFYESNTTSTTLRPPTLIYESERPWIGKSVMATSRSDSRPVSHVHGAAVTLQSGNSAMGSAILKHDAKKNVYQVLINGHVDRGRSKVEINPEKSVYMVIKIHDDYHYYTRNGRQQRSGTWYGTVRSNPVKVQGNIE